MALRSIRWTLQLWHAGILALALASLGVALYVSVSRAQYTAADAELEGAARVVADRLRPPPPPPGPPGPHRRFETGRVPGRGPGPGGRRGFEGGPGFDPFGSPPPPPGGFAPDPREGHPPPPRGLIAAVPPDLLRRVGQDEAEQPYFVVYAPDGAVIRSSFGPAPRPAPQGGAPEPPAVPTSGGGGAIPPPAPPPNTAQRPAPQFRQRGDRREVILPGPQGTRVLVGRSTRRERDELRRLLLVLLLAGGGVLGVGLAGGWLLADRAVRPIDAITETARAISATDLARRIDVAETRSELGALAATLNETFARLEAAFARQVRFTADASHELRTPLSVIHSHLELALAKDRTGDEYRRTIETALRASKRMRSLIEALLVLARADAGGLELKRQTFDLGEVVNDCAAMLTPLAADRHVSIVTDLRAAFVSADRTRVSQVVTNLLNNAIAYNREGGRVEVALAAHGGDAALIVADTGVGIPAADLPRLFERFYRADRSRNRDTGGTGLGLAICKTIVETHGGSISVTSREGAGTTFTVRLPAPGPGGGMSETG